MAWFEFTDAATPSKRECHSMSVVDTRLVCFGGNNDTTRMNDIHILDTGAFERAVWRRWWCRVSRSAHNGGGSSCRSLSSSS